MDVVDGVKEVLRDTLELGARAASFQASTRLFGSLPEFDSMAVVSVVLGLEERFDMTIDEDEIGAETFETVGSLTLLVESKLAQR
ncbi:MAG: acyl carrier protein [Planctomycetota bacterium]|jgi:acyl carrier protein